MQRGMRKTRAHHARGGRSTTCRAPCVPKGTHDLAAKYMQREKQITKKMPYLAEGMRTKCAHLTRGGAQHKVPRVARAKGHARP